MKTSGTILFALTILVSNALFGQEHSDKGIKFETGTWAEITAKAKKENKLIFLDAYASWCGPCKWMAKNVFTNDTVANFYNSNFINAKIDMEKGEGVELAKKYGVQAYPTMFYINGNGEMVHRICGSAPAAAFMASTQNALDPQKQLSSMQKNFNSKKNDPVFIQSYFAAVEGACMTPDNKEVNAYFDLQKESDYKSRTNWNVIYNYLSDASSPVFQYIVKNRKDYSALYGKDSVEKKIAQVYSASLIEKGKANDSQGVENLKAELRNSGLGNANMIIAEADMSIYRKQKDWKNYGLAAENYINENKNISPRSLNSIAWSFYEHIEEKAMLQKAVDWSKRSVEMENSYANNDTYAALLYKSGRKEEAEKAAEKAIDLAKQSGEDYAETEALLKKMREPAVKPAKKKPATKKKPAAKKK
jgi:thiol-disulfide isomerase/thioredoxin